MKSQFHIHSEIENQMRRVKKKQAWITRNGKLLHVLSCLAIGVGLALVAVAVVVLVS